MDHDHDPHALALAMRSPDESASESDRLNREGHAALDRARAEANRGRDNSGELAESSRLYREADAYAAAADHARGIFADVDDDRDPHARARRIVSDAFAALARLRDDYTRGAAAAAVGDWPDRSASVNRAARLASASIAADTYRDAIERAHAAAFETLAPGGIDPDAVDDADEIAAHREAAESKGHPWPPMQRPATMTATAWAVVKSDFKREKRS